MKAAIAPPAPAQAKGRSLLHRAAIMACLASFCLIPANSAQAQAPRVFDLPRQPLGGALAGLADAAGVQILFDPSVTKGMQAPRLQGRFAVEVALVRLLGGSGLEAVRVDGHTFLVRLRVPAAPRPAPKLRAPAAPVLLPPQVSPLDIIVTAARYRQSAQHVSASLALVSGADINSQALTTVSEILDGQPGISTSSQPSGYSINIRGLGADMPNGTTQGAVALEFDGVYSIVSLGTTTGFLDVDRVEVIKGPQSTRYGPNAEGGVVNVITREPVLGSLAGSASLSVGKAALLRAEAAQNVPLGQNVALRIAGSVESRDSWFHPALANLRNQSLRVGLLARPGPDLTLRLTYQVDHIGGTGTGSEGGFPVLIDRVAPYAGDSINAKGDPWSQGDRASGSYDPALNHTDLYQQSITGKASVGLGRAVAVDVTVAHLAVSGSQVSCVRDGAPWVLSGQGSCYSVYGYAPFNQTSSELRLHGTGKGGLQWSVGHYFWQFGKSSWSQENQPVAGREGGERIGMRTQALFGELVVPVAPRLRLVVGGRQSWDHRVLRPVSVAQTYTRDFSHADIRLAQEYDLAEGVMQYATLATGYRPGGLAYDGTTGTAQSFASETTKAFETGLKGRFWGGALQLNLAAFAYWQSHYQDIDSYNGYTVTLASGSAYVCGASAGQPAACALPVFNIASAHNLGAEMQARLKLTHADTLRVDGTFTRARFGSHLGTCATVAAPSSAGCWIGYNDQITGALRFFRLDGTVQPHSPAFATTIAYEHTARIRPGWELTLGGQAYHSASYWVGPVQDADLLGFQPGYWQAGLTARIAVPERGLTLTAWLRNLTNYAVKMSTLPAATIGEPRNFGLTAAVAW